MRYLAGLLLLVLAFDNNAAEVNEFNSTNYCNLKRCGTKHIACDHIGFGHRCHEPKLIEMDASLKGLILALHNVKRNEVAGGTSRLQAAVRMPTVQWDEELAHLAQLNTMTCVMRHDKCHSTTKFPYPGQNIGQYSYSGKENRMTNEHIVRSIILSQWLSEHSHAKDFDILQLRSNKLPIIGLFCNVINDKVTHIGCGLIRFVDVGDRMHSIIITCNYSKSNIIGNAVYKTGLTAANCKTGKNPKYPNLCSEAETFDEI